MKFCPQCSLVLEETAWEGTSPWACRSCGGAWWTGAESAAALGSKRAALGALNAAYPGVATAGMFEGLPLACPDCRTAFLDEAPLPHAPDQSIPTCGKCGGVWLTPSARAALSDEEAEAAPPAPNNGGASTAARDAVLPAAVESTAASAPSDLAPDAPPSAKAPPLLGAGGAAPYEPDVVEEEPVELEPPATEEAPPELGAGGATIICPRCLTALPADAAICPECRVALVEPAFRILCPSCSAVNPFTAERCARCDMPLRTPERLAQLYPHVPTVNAPHERPAPDGPTLLTEAAPAAPPVVAGAVGATAQRWCPQCRRAYPATESMCADCGAGLAEGSYRVRCLRCNSENTLAAELCWNCHAPIHPPELQSGRGPLPPPAALPSDSWSPPARPPSGSCLGSVLSAVIVMIVLAIAFAVALAR